MYASEKWMKSASSNTIDIVYHSQWWKIHVPEYSVHYCNIKSPMNDNSCHNLCQSFVYILYINMDILCMSSLIFDKWTYCCGRDSDRVLIRYCDPWIFLHHDIVYIYRCACPYQGFVTSYWLLSLDKWFSCIWK